MFISSTINGTYVIAADPCIGYLRNDSLTKRPFHLEVIQRGPDELIAGFSVKNFDVAGDPGIYFAQSFDGGYSWTHEPRDPDRGSSAALSPAFEHPALQLWRN